jgi:hypothetical protein
MPTHGDPQMREVYAEALAGADPASKSLLGSGGSEGNLASNAALESTRPSIETQQPPPSRCRANTVQMFAPATFQDFKICRTDFTTIT